MTTLQGCSRLGQRLAEEAERRLQALDANDLSAAEAIELFEAGVEIERLALGQPDEIVEVRGAPEDTDVLVGAVLMRLRRSST